MGRRLKQTFFQRGQRDGQQLHEKMLNTTYHERNAYQNHNEITSHTCQNDYKRQQTTNVCKKGTPVTVLGGYKLVHQLWKTVWRFHDPETPVLGIYPEKIKTLIWKDTYIPTLRAALFTIAKIQKQPKCPSWEERIKKKRRCVMHVLKWKSESEVTESCPTLCDPVDCSPPGCLWDFPGKNTGLGCHFLLQEIFPTQGLNPGLLHCRQMLYRLRHQESPVYMCVWYAR